MRFNSTGTFYSNEQWLEYLEELLGSEGSAYAAKLFANYLSDEHQLDWDSASDDTQITDKMFQKALAYIESCELTREENENDN